MISMLIYVLLLASGKIDEAEKAGIIKRDGQK